MWLSDPLTSDPFWVLWCRSSAIRHCLNSSAFPVFLTLSLRRAHTACNLLCVNILIHQLYRLADRRPRPPVLSPPSLHFLTPSPCLLSSSSSFYYNPGFLGGFFFQVFGWSLRKAISRSACEQMEMLKLLLRPSSSSPLLPAFLFFPPFTSSLVILAPPSSRPAQPRPLSGTILVNYLGRWRSSSPSSTSSLYSRPSSTFLVVCVLWVLCFSSNTTKKYIDIFKKKNIKDFSKHKLTKEMNRTFSEAWEAPT